MMEVVRVCEEVKRGCVRVGSKERWWERTRREGFGVRNRRPKSGELLRLSRPDGRYTTLVATPSHRLVAKECAELLLYSAGGLSREKLR